MTNTSLIHQNQALSDRNKEIVEPLHCSTIFAMKKPSSDEGFQYGRVGNPTRQLLNEILSRYADTKHALSLSSGSVAISSLFLMLKSGDKVICHNDIYEGTRRILLKHFRQLGINSVFIDCANLKTLGKELQEGQNEKLVLVESPTNPLLQILDIKKISQLVHQYQATLAVDNTFATSLLQKPISLGADVIIESLSKHISGHSDVIGGVLGTNNKNIFLKTKSIAETLGFTLSPRDAHEVLKGLKTMELRVNQQCKNALRIANFLKNQPQISRVLFPTDKLSQQQMKQAGTIISFNIKNESSMFLKKLKLIKIAHSFGGVETLIQQPSIMMDLSTDKKQLNSFQINDRFFRLSVGIENATDIISDLKQALS
jgi:cystathionine beta-lyase/cystathionine gamma-synthase